MKRLIALGALIVALAGCAKEGDNPAKLDLGDFALGHNIVVAPDLKKGPTSRDATPEELTASLKAQLDKRLGRYEGDRLVHIGVNIGAYVLARGGVPLVYTPKSVLAMNVTVWDDRAGTKFHDEPKQVIVLENLGESLIIGSGHTQTREEQIEGLTLNAARAIEKWLAENAACLRDEPTEKELENCWKDKKTAQSG